MDYNNNNQGQDQGAGNSQRAPYSTQFSQNVQGAYGQQGQTAQNTQGAYGQQFQNGQQFQQNTQGYNGQYQQPNYNQGYNQQYQQNNFSQANYSQQGFGPQQPRYSSQQRNAYSNPSMDFQQGMCNSPYAEAPQKPGPYAFQVISLILGIISLLCCCTGIIGMIIGAVGIILAVIGNKAGKHGVGTGGLVCSIIGFILALIILGLSVLTSYAIPRDMNDWYEYFERYENYY